MSSRAALAALLSLFFLRSQTANAQAAPWQDFGSVAAGGAGAPVNVNFSFPSAPGAKSFRMAFGSDFLTGAASCHPGGCTIPVTFQPRLAGLREDAVQALDAAGNLLASVSVKGIGLAPQLAFLPAALSTAAGTGAWGSGGDGGPATAALFGNPQSVAVDSAGGVYVADSLNDNVRYISAGGVISTVAGTGAPGFSGDGGPAPAAQLDTPGAVALDAAGDIFIADSGNNRIRRVDVVSHIITTVAGNGQASFSGDGSLATNASLYGPAAVSVDFTGAVYIADTYNNRVRKIDASGKISTVAGGGTASLSAATSPVAGTTVALLNPAGLCLDPAGNVFIADSGNHVVAKLATAGISVVAGTGNPGFSGDGGAATAAQLQSPSGLAVDAAGDLYISDSNNSVVRLVAGGQISTIAGNPGQFGFGGDGGAAAESVLNDPAGVALDSTGKLYVADQGNRRIRLLNFAGAPVSFPNTVAGVISAARTLTAWNAGNEASTLTGLGVSNAFAQQISGHGDCATGASIAPGSLCLALLTFEPASTGAFSGTLQISDDTNNSATRHALQLTGTAVTGAAPNISLSPAALSFPSQALGTISNPQAFTISNSGSAPLVLGSLALNGTNAADFQLRSTCGSSVPSGGNCTVSIGFAPHGLGARSAVLTINDDAIGSPHAVALSGAGTNVSARVAAMPIAVFGTGLTSGNALSVEGSVDSHWTVSSADWVHPGPRAYLVASASLPAGWLANGPDSAWIAPTASGSTYLAGGSYVYRTTFDLTGLDANTASLAGTIAAAGSATALLNGVAVSGLSASGTGNQTPFRIGSGFVSGMNTLDIVVSAGVAGPKGLRLTISGSVQRIAAVPIAVFGTGVTKGGTLAIVGAADSNYTLESGGPAAYIVPAATGWAANGPDSNWIAPSTAAETGAVSVYRTSFDLTGLNPSTAILFGRMAAAGSVTVKLNGTTISNIPATNAVSLVPFVIGSGFLTGVNVLEFSVTVPSAGSTGLRPAALRVDLTGSAQAAGPTAIPLWGTGSGSSGLAPDGVADAHYFLETGGLLAAPGPAAYVAPTGALPAGWAANGPASKWITPAQTLNPAFPAGTYTYRTTFDLTGLNLATVVLNGHAAATGAIAVTLNGVAVSNLTASNTGSLQPFTITNGFAGGVNTLEFSVITTSSGPAGLRVDLSGTAESDFGSGSASLSATLLPFAPQAIGTTSAAQSVTITNTSTAPLQISGIFPNGPGAIDFGVNTTCSSLLNAGATCSVAATFTPSAWGAQTAFLALTDSAGDSPQVITLTGMGAASNAAPARTFRARSVSKNEATAAVKSTRGRRNREEWKEEEGQNAEEGERLTALSLALPQRRSVVKARKSGVHHWWYCGGFEDCYCRSCLQQLELQEPVRK